MAGEGTKMEKKRTRKDEFLYSLSYLARDGAAAAAEKERRPAPLEHRAQHFSGRGGPTKREMYSDARANKLPSAFALSSFSGTRRKERK